MSRRPPTVLLVSDGDPAYTGRLREFCTVRHAYTGQQARDSFGPDLDVALLDGPVLGFDADALASATRRHGCRAVAVTDAPPDALPERVETVPRSVPDALCRDALATLLPAAEPASPPTDGGGGDRGGAVTSTTAEAQAAAAVRKFLE